MPLSSSSAPDEEGRLRAELATANAELERVRIDAAAYEQRRLAKALHDTICQSLSGITLITHAISRKYRTSSPDAAAAMDEVGKLLQRATDEVHDLVRWLQPTEFKEAEELAPALAELAEITTKKVPCELRTSNPTPVFDRYHAAQLYQLGKDAVNYALHQGGATRIILTLTSVTDHITLAVQIDGLDLQFTSSNELISGLELLQHRARIIGATVTLESTVKRSVLSFHVPIRDVDR